MLIILRYVMLLMATLVFPVSADNTSQESGGTGSLIITLIIIFLLFRFFRTKCPACKSKNLKKVDRKIYHTDKTWTQTPHTQAGSYIARRVTVVTYRCKDCGFQFDKTSNSKIQGGEVDHTNIRALSQSITNSFHDVECLIDYG